MSGLYFFCYLLPCDVFGVLCRWTWWCFFLGFFSFFCSLYKNNCPKICLLSRIDIPLHRNWELQRIGRLAQLV